MIRITSKKNGFWRCGVNHSTEPQTYPDDKFSAKQLDRLKKEPMLVVQEVAGNPEEQRPNVAKSIELIKAAATMEDIDRLAQGEDRKSVLEAIEKRRKELSI